MNDPFKISYPSCCLVWLWDWLRSCRQCVFIDSSESDYHSFIMFMTRQDNHIIKGLPKKNIILPKSQLLVRLQGRLAEGMQTVFIDSSDCHPLLMTGIVSPGGLCSPLLCMSSFVLPPGGPNLSSSFLPVSFEWDHFTSFDSNLRWNWSFGFRTYWC